MWVTVVTGQSAFFWPFSHHFHLIHSFWSVSLLIRIAFSLHSLDSQKLHTLSSRKLSSIILCGFFYQASTLCYTSATSIRHHYQQNAYCIEDTIVLAVHAVCQLCRSCCRCRCTYPSTQTSRPEYRGWNGWFSVSRTLQLRCTIPIPISIPIPIRVGVRVRIYIRITITILSCSYH